MEKNSNKSLIALIIILIIVIFGLVGYIVYDKVLVESETTTEARDGNNVEKQEVVSESEEVKELDKLEFESINGMRQVYVTEEGSISCSDCNPVSFENTKVIALEKASSCNGNYNIYMVTDNGKVYVNKSTSAYFEKIEPFEITTTEKIVDIENFDNSSVSCYSSNVALIGESGTKYYPMLECTDAGHTITKVTLTTDKEEFTTIGSVCIPK